MNYEVGSWFVYLLDFAILCIVGMIVLIVIFVKRNKYQKEATTAIRAEIQLPTGWSEFHVVPCNSDARSVSIDDFNYMLNPAERRYGRYPMSPFMGLSWLQVPIRTETWFLDCPEPMRKTYSPIVATAAEIKAMTREVQATTAAMQIQEIDERQKELTNAIGNQPNKTYVYIGLGACALMSLISLIIVAQLAGIA